MQALPKQFQTKKAATLAHQFLFVAFTDAGVGITKFPCACLRFDCFDMTDEQQLGTADRADTLVCLLVRFV